MRPWWILVTLAACNPEETLQTAEGVSVSVDDAGALVLSAGDRVLLAFADDAPVEVGAYTETWTAPAGIWTFERTGESREAVRGYDGDAADAGGAITLGYGAGSLAIEVADVAADHTRVTLTPQGLSGSSLVLRLACPADATLHGWGEQYGATDQRGAAFDLFVSEQGIGRTGGSARNFTGDAHTTYFPMPFWLDAHGGTGVLVHTDFRVRADLCARDSEVVELEVTELAPVSLSVFHGPTPRDVVRQLGDALGRPEAPPAWAWGLWAAIQGGSQAVRDELAALQAAGIDPTAMWAQDWTGERRNLGGGFGVEYRWVEDPERYPGLAGLIDELHDQDVRFLGYANPFIDADLDDHFPILADNDWLLTDAAGDPYTFFAPNGTSAHPDLTIPEAREQVKVWLRAMITDLGMDGWMVDFSEWTPLDAVVADGTDGRAYHNRFPVHWQELTREVFEETRPDGDWVSFARAGWTGAQATSRVHWVGDQEATWEHEDGLPTVVPAMVNLGLSGIPFTTHDIAGFSGGPSTKELFQRWVELGAFTPIMRTHDGDNKDDNWRWDRDADTTAHFARMVAVHDALEPLFTELAQEAEATSVPMVRHLMLDWPDDPETWPLSDQFALGDGMIVAPVVEPGATTRELYLPEGDWYHLWTGDIYSGPIRLTVDAPIGEPPVFTREDRPDLRALP